VLKTVGSIPRFLTLSTVYFQHSTPSSGVNKKSDARFALVALINRTVQKAPGGAIMSEGEPRRGADGNSAISATCLEQTGHAVNLWKNLPRAHRKRRRHCPRDDGRQREHFPNCLMIDTRPAEVETRTSGGQLGGGFDQRDEQDGQGLATTCHKSEQCCVDNSSAYFNYSEVSLSTRSRTEVYNQCQRVHSFFNNYAQVICGSRERS